MFTGNISIGNVDLYDQYKLIALDIGSSSMLETHYGITQSVIEEKTTDMDVPHFFGVDRKPFTFSINLVLDTLYTWNYQKRLDFAKLIFKPYYQELKSASEPQVVYKVICINDPKKVLNGIDQGYITLTFRTDAPWAWSPLTVINKVVTGADDANPYTFTLENNSNILDWYYPEVEFNLTGTTEIKMTNDKDIDRPFEFTGLVDGEVVYIDNRAKKIIGDQPYPNNYRLANFNNNWFRLNYGVNNISVYRDCIINFRMQYPIAI